MINIAKLAHEAYEYSYARQAELDGRVDNKKARRELYGLRPELQIAWVDTVGWIYQQVEKSLREEV